MQVRFCVFFEKKSFLPHYERQKNEKKISFSRFFSSSIRPGSCRKGKNTSIRTPETGAGRRAKPARTHRTCGSAKRARSVETGAERRAIPARTHRTCGSVKRARSVLDSTPIRLESDFPACMEKRKAGRRFETVSGRDRGSQDHLEVAWIISSMMLTDSLR